MNKPTTSELCEAVTLALDKAKRADCDGEFFLSIEFDPKTHKLVLQTVCPELVTEPPADEKPAAG